MNALQITLGILALIAAAVVIVMVAGFQTGKKGMSGVISGGNGGSYYERNKSSSKEATYSKVTLIACIVFAVLVLALFLSQADLGKDESSAAQNSSAAQVSEAVSDASVADTSADTSAEASAEDTSVVEETSAAA